MTASLTWQCFHFQRPGSFHSVFLPKNDGNIKWIIVVSPLWVIQGSLLTLDLPADMEWEKKMLAPSSTEIISNDTSPIPITGAKPYYGIQPIKAWITRKNKESWRRKPSIVSRKPNIEITVLSIYFCLLIEMHHYKLQQ